jgi:aspartate aminotransferase
MDSSTSSGPRSAARVSRRVDAIEKPILINLNAKIQERRDAGEDVVDLAASDADFPTPQPILEAAAIACGEPRFHGYTPVPGLPELRQAVADNTRRRTSYDVSISQVLVTNGVEHAVYQACATLLDPGDEVLLPTPYRAIYPEAISLANGVPVEVAVAQSEWPVDLDAIEKSRTDRTKALMLCSPSDPTGALCNADQAKEIGQWALAHDIWVIVDETYAEVVYGSADYLSLPAYTPALAEQCVIISGPPQVYAMSNWRIAWMIGPRDVITAATGLQSHMTSNVFNVSQAAALAAVTRDFAELGQRQAVLDEHRSIMVTMLDKVPGLSCREPVGAIFCFPSVSSLLGREIRNRRPVSSEDLAQLILDETGVAVAPGEAFGAPGYLRLNYAVDKDAMISGIARISELLSEAR